MNRVFEPARISLLAIVTCLLFASACSSTAGQPHHLGSSTVLSSRPPTSPQRTVTSEAGLTVTQHGFQAVSFEHWVGGSAVIDSGTTWGVIIHNATERTALDVTLTVTFVADGSASKREGFRIDELPPGDTAVGGYPVVFADKAGRPVAVAALRATVHATEWATTSRPRDRLISSNHLAIGAWHGTVRIEPVEDARSLFVMVAYFGADGDLLSVDPNRIDPDKLQAGSTMTVHVAGRPEGGGSGATAVGVFLLRISDTTGLVPAPARGPRG